MLCLPLLGKEEEEVDHYEEKKDDILSCSRHPRSTSLIQCNVYNTIEITLKFLRNRNLMLIYKAIN